MTNLDKLNKLFDDYLTKHRKSFISLRTGNDLLKNSKDPDLQNIDLKKLLESGMLPHSGQTQTAPKQWRIFHSKQDRNLEEQHNSEKVIDWSDEFLNPIKYNAATKTFSNAKNSDGKYESDKITIIALIAIGGLIALFTWMKSHQEDSVKQKYPETATTEIVSETSESNNNQGLQKFKSTFNDKEYIKGGLIQTNNEITYHEFDFNNKVVYCYAPVEGKYIKFTYPMKSFYKESGALASTYVITVETLGVREIWFSPEVPNIGYDYDDGTRVSCYGIERVNEIELK